MVEMKEAAAGADCLEVFIECFTKGELVKHRWSIWIDGKQLVSSHGYLEYPCPDSARTDALLVCNELKREPDRITQL